ncbi:lipopolysaccharide biosynthesis protein [Paenibacillus xylaniclasticus]|uniref:lipopolysaccharide biosynthesis protein n=1 Tax=Paenibacillus xylaniclasticus TaxID=588083 RepID=UPI0013DFD08A|nr:MULTISPECIES: lipopolysaccharide biosynthesis protein [Paenibacillus]GFN29856.1 lipopolysaccharide biosynthesis protein [Paenibacillus curdlanolyticus]
MKENAVTLKKAAMINVAARYTNIVIQIVANAILARMLSADDYGIIAVILVFTSFFVLLSDMGLGAGIVQNKTLTADDDNHIFSVTVYASFILMALFLLLAYPIAWFYNNEKLLPVSALLSITVLFSTMNIVPNALLMKNKRFKLVGIRTITVTGISYVVAIILAAYGYKYYALVVQSIVVATATFLLNLWSTKLKLHANFKFNSIMKIFGFSVYDFGFNIINYFARNTDSLLTGKFMSSAALGFYSRAYNLMLYPVMNLTHVITPILHPILSDHQDNKEYIYDKYIKVYKCLSLMGVFVSVFSYFAAEELIYIVYGPKWDAVVPCMAALGVSIWFQMTASSCGSIYRSIGLTKLMFKSVLVYVPVQLAMIIAGVLSKDIVTLSWCVAVSFMLKYFIEYFFLVGIGFQKSVFKFLYINVPELIIAVLMAAVMVLSSNNDIDNGYLSLLYKLVICAVVYAVGLAVTKQYSYFFILLPHRLRNKLPGVHMKKSRESSLNNG